MIFSEFGFHPNLADGLDAMGFTQATPIQEQAIPQIVAGRDLIACAQTGTGKTAAFLLPVLNYLCQNPDRSGTQVLVVVPTRELALQIDQQVEALGYFTGAGSLPVYGGGGGDGFEQQKRALIAGADIIVATPGRFIAHIQLGYVKLDSVKFLILDEADRMLDMGFSEDLAFIVKQLPAKRQSLLFSATMPPKIRELTKTLLHDPFSISLSISKPAAGVKQGAYLAYDAQKIALIQSILEGKEEEYKAVIVFSSTKKKVLDIYHTLRKKGMSVAAISSDLEQKEREEVLQRFRNRKVQILVATDVLSRGIDIKEISLVINFDVPPDAEDYVHRVGRTARADTKGVALTFINEYDQVKFKSIEDLIEQEVEKIPMPEGLGKGPEYRPDTRVARPPREDTKRRDAAHAGRANKGGEKPRNPARRPDNRNSAPRGGSKPNPNDKP